MVSLRRGQLDVRLNAGRGESRLASTGSEYADGHFHSLALTKVLSILGKQYNTRCAEPKCLVRTSGTVSFHKDPNRKMFMNKNGSGKCGIFSS